MTWDLAVLFEVVPLRGFPTSIELVPEFQNIDNFYGFYNLQFTNFEPKNNFKKLIIFIDDKEAEIQLQLKRFQDSSISSLICSWLIQGWASGH